GEPKWNMHVWVSLEPRSGPRLRRGRSSRRSGGLAQAAQRWARATRGGAEGAADPGAKSPAIHDRGEGQLPGPSQSPAVHHVGGAQTVVIHSAHAPPTLQTPPKRG